MSVNISVSVNSAQASNKPAPYLTTITINSGENITKYLFVKRQSVNIDGSINNKYINVAYPEDITNVPQQAPIAPNNVWRDSTITLISSDSSWLTKVTQDILNDLLVTVQQVQNLTTFTMTANYTIDSSIGIISASTPVPILTDDGNGTLNWTYSGTAPAYWSISVSYDDNTWTQFDKVNGNVLTVANNGEEVVSYYSVIGLNSLNQPITPRSNNVLGSVKTS